ncbi:hypothetical protein AB0I72_08865 [Nocardiopsis sp. NPDC049922]|uniref:hypothetical protein n=1 Tax=Nocardiopsis sp. NPDC049922 TaxID=3155157 RepID=UPI0033F76A54
MAVHVYPQEDGTYELRIVVLRQERDATLAVLKEAGVEQPQELLQESEVVATITAFLTSVGTLGLKDVLIALIQKNKDKKFTMTTVDTEVELTGYSAKELTDVLKTLGLSTSSEPQPDAEVEAS